MKSGLFEKCAFFIQPAMVFLVMFGVSAYLSTIGVEPHHDGIMLKPAIDFAEGKILFKESFSQYGALTVIIQGVAIKIFGEYLIVVRILTAFFYGLTGFFLWLIWRKILPGWLSSIACFVWILLAPEYFTNLHFIPWSSIYALFFLVLSCYFLMLHIERKSLIYVFLSGFAAAMAFWCRQPVGVFLCASISVFLVMVHFMSGRMELKNLFSAVSVFLAGVVSVSSVFLVWLVFNGALHDWWIQQIYFAQLFAMKESSRQGLVGSVVNCLFVTAENSDIPRNTNIWILMPVICLFLLVKIIAIWLEAVLMTAGGKCSRPTGAIARFAAFLHSNIGRSKGSILQEYSSNGNGTAAGKPSLPEKELLVLALVFVSLASWMQYYPIPCTRHVFWAATPMVGLAVYFTYDLLSRNVRRFGAVLALFVIFAFFGYDMISRAMEGIEKSNQKFVSFKKPNILAGMKLTEGGYKYYAEIQRIMDEYLKAHPGSEVISIGQDALYLTFRHNENFHPLYVYWEDMVALYPDYDRRLSSCIKEKKPMIVSNRMMYPGYRLVKFHSYVNIDGYTEMMISVPNGN